MADSIYPLKNNSKKISEFRGRDFITYHQSYSWIPLAQYDDRIGSYVNLAINISSITGYSASYSGAYLVNVIDEQKELLNVDEWYKLLNVGYAYNPGYISTELYDAVNNSIISENLNTYIYSYTSYVLGWQYLFGVYDRPQIEYEEFLYTELEEYILTPRGDKIMIDDDEHIYVDENGVSPDYYDQQNNDENNG